MGISGIELASQKYYWNQQGIRIKEGITFILNDSILESIIFFWCYTLYLFKKGNMKQVGVFRLVFPLLSETFIMEQSSNLKEYKPTFLVRSKLHNFNVQNISLSDQDFIKIKQLLYLLTRAAFLFKETEILNNLNLIHAHFGPDGVYALPLAEKLGIPLVVTTHGYHTELYRRSLLRPWNKNNRLRYQSLQFLIYEKELKAKASAFIAVSRFVAKQLIEGGYPQEKIILHYIGVDTVKFSPATEDANERYILCVGRHELKKGIDTLLRAFTRIASRYPDISLVQVGTGSLGNTSSLHALADDLGVKNRVYFLGGQPHETVLELMRGAEIFALSSQTTKSGNTEGLPYSINEASACGVPVVSTWHSGIPEAVLDGETGLLAPERDDQLLAEKLDVLLSDRALGKKMGQRGREYVCEMFDIRKQTAKLEKIYDHIIEKSHDTTAKLIQN